MQPEGWVFPSSRSGTGHVAGVGHFHAGIGEAGGAKFWFHGLRNAFITVAERELVLPRSLTKRLVNHARPPDVTEGYATDWTVEQLRDPAQRVADHIDALMAEEVYGTQSGRVTESGSASPAPQLRVQSFLPGRQPTDDRQASRPQ